MVLWNAEQVSNFSLMQWWNKPNEVWFWSMFSLVGNKTKPLSRWMVINLLTFFKGYSSHSGHRDYYFHWILSKTALNKNVCCSSKCWRCIWHICYAEHFTVQCLMDLSQTFFTILSFWTSNLWFYIISYPLAFEK